MKTRQEIFIDTLGACNLKCPSCPTGRREEILFSTKLLTADRLRQILAKASTECRLTRVNLFNWTDSLLHPQIAALISIIQDEFGLPARLSTNLNHTAGLAELPACPPRQMIISLSGFTQPIYEQTHAGGDIEKVKENMAWLSNTMRWDAWPTHVTVAWHRYRSNLHEEVPMARYARRLAFHFAPVMAVLMPLEAIIENTPLPILSNLLIQPRDAIAKCAWWPKLSCHNRSHHIVLDSMAKMTLCCPTFDADRFHIGDFLSTPLSVLQSRKNQHHLCSACQHTGVLTYLQGAGPMRWLARRHFHSSTTDATSPIGEKSGKAPLARR